MFQAVGLRLEGDHLDLSFSDPSSWTNALHEIDAPNQFVALGDPDTGPTIMLSAMSAYPADLWFDTHYHGSDQFRAIIRGEFMLQKHRMGPGDFGYQESGRVYREGVTGAPDGCWMFSMHGTWRGARSTRTRRDGTFDLPELTANQLDRWADTPDDPCWWNVRGGPKGIAALKSTLGPNRAGYAWGSFNDPAGWQKLTDGVMYTAGMFGLPDTGPIVFTLKADAEGVILPPSSSETEICCCVVRGTAGIGGKSYGKGDLRIQRGGSPLEAIQSGPEGLEMVYVIADRRRLPQFSAGAPLSQRWADLLASTVQDLAPADDQRVLEGAN